MTINDLTGILSVLGAFGAGGIIGGYFQQLWDRRKEAQSHKQEFKEARYKCIILLMYAALDFDTHAPLLRQHGRDFRTIQDLMTELKTEWYNMMLFASDDVLATTHYFIQRPNQTTFQKSVLAMRNDLWGGRLSHRVLMLDFPASSS